LVVKEMERDYQQRDNRNDRLTQTQCFQFLAADDVRAADDSGCTLGMGRLSTQVDSGIGMRRWLRLPKYGNYARNDGQTIICDGLGFGSVKPSILTHTSRSPWSLRPFLESGIAMITIAETADAAADDPRGCKELSRLFPRPTSQKQPNPAGNAAPAISL
jgi:hypothetical protein